MSSSTTNALPRQPLVQVLRNITDPRDRRGVRHNPVYSPVSGCDGGAGRLSQPDSDMGARHRPDRRRPGGPGTS